MRYSYRFAANVKINAFANVLVSNNRINDAITDNYDQPGYKVTDVGGNRIVNRNLLGREESAIPLRKSLWNCGKSFWEIPFQKNRICGISDNTTGIIPQRNCHPGQLGLLYHEDSNSGGDISAESPGTRAQQEISKGQGLVIKDNTIRDQENKQWWIHSTGTKQPKGSNTFENRAIDWSGWDVVIEGNDYQVYRHRIMDSKYYSVDGEGILIQECCGGTKGNGAIIRNNQGNGYIGLYKVPEIKNVTITGNRLDSQWKKTPLIYVSADRNRGPSSISNVRIENNRVNGSILAKSSLGGTGNRIENNRGDNSGSIKYSCQITVSGNTEFELEPCLPGKT